MKRFFIFSLLCLVVTSCTTSVWSNPAFWYKSTGELNPAYADVFYLVSTNILHEEDAAGNVLYRALNTPQELSLLSREMAHMENKVFADSLNFFAPYYHQHTMDAISLDPAEYNALVSDIVDEVYSAFQYYLTEFNGGRPVVLVGFSQGANLAKEMLKRMTPSEFSHIAATYVLGWGLSASDLECSQILPARGADDTGVCISFNSVADTSCIWPAVMNGATCSINPVNWCTDATPADFDFSGQTLSVRLDTSRMVLDVDGFSEPSLPFVPVWPAGCYHFYEIQFYNSYLNANALLRVNNFR